MMSSRAGVAALLLGFGMSATVTPANATFCSVTTDQSDDLAYCELVGNTYFNVTSASLSEQ
jgi:hypothetical protein